MSSKKGFSKFSIVITISSFSRSNTLGSRYLSASPCVSIISVLIGFRGKYGPVLNLREFESATLISISLFNS